MNLTADAPPAGTVRDWLDARADAQGEAIYFPETGARLTWEDLREQARSIATNLTARGYRKGESVAIMHPNGMEGVIAMYGAYYGGFRATMINLAAGPEAIGFALDHSGARIAFVHSDQRELFARVCPDRMEVYTADDRGGGDLHDITAQDDALLMYTSGTTGRPKGVVHTHASLLAGGWTASIAHNLGPTDCGFCVLPMYHINGQCVTIMGSLVSGGTLAMVSRFSVSRFWDQAQSGGITWFSVVPTIISHLLHGEAEPSEDLKANIRFGRSASSALAVETQTAFQNRFGIAIVETMGLTETAAQCLSNPLDRTRQKIGSPGVAVGNEARIADADGRVSPTDTEGEIQIRGPNVMKAYLKNPEETARTFIGAWLRTGDLGRMDADGYIFVTGRLKELIIKGGENIAPREIDEALYEHADVVEAAAFARPCSQYGERVEAAVRLRPGSAATAAALKELCTTRVGKFKAPDTVHILDELPKGPSGKIQRLYLNKLIHG